MLPERVKVRYFYGMHTFLHERLTRSLLEDIASGAWRAGQRFLSVRDISRLWNVSQPTITASVRTLQDKGILRPSPRRGYFLRSEFQQKAQVLLRRNKTPSIKRPIRLEQKLRLLQGISGGKIALLLESRSTDTAPLEECDELLPSLSPSVRRCAKGFVREGRKYHFTPHYFVYDGKKKSGEWIRRRLEEGDYAGAVVFCRSSHRMIRSTLESMMKKRLPIVIMYDDCHGLPVHSININNVGLGYDALRHLYRMGHRKIAILARKTLLKLHKARIKGCLLAQTEGECRDAKLKVLKVGRTASLTPAMYRYFSNPATRPTAVFALETWLILKLVPVRERHGLSIPEDISVILCSSKKGVPGSEALDSMQLKIGARIGRMAARQLHRIQTGEPLEKSVLLDVAYVKRGSVRRMSLETGAANKTQCVASCS